MKSGDLFDFCCNQREINILSSVITMKSYFQVLAQIQKTENRVKIPVNIENIRLNSLLCAVFFNRNKMQEYNFDDIRPYTDKEVKGKIRLLIKDPVFDEVLMHMFKW